MYGNPETTTGGRALKFYSSVRLEVRKGEVIKGAGGESIGAQCKVKIVKNKVAPPFKEVVFDLMFGKGIDRTGEVCDMAVNLGVINKSGSWFSYNGEKIGQGRDKAKEFLNTHPDIMAEVEKAVMANSEELDFVSRKEKKGKKDASDAGKSSAIDEVLAEDAVSVDIDIDADDDYTEIAPE